VKTRDLTELAVRNLREAVLRNSLTTLGVAVGVASLVALLSLGVGLQTLASERLTRSGLFDAVFVTLQRDFRGARRPRSDNSTPKKEARVLDEDARQQLARLASVTEVYPQVRFITEVSYAGKSPTTSVLGLPNSSRGSGAFEGMTGSYFSSPEAAEAILQVEFAKELTDQPATLVGKELVLRYAERAALSLDNGRNGSFLKGMMGAAMPGGISIVPREKILRIVGVIESDPSAGFGGFGGARIFLPLATAEHLHVAQPDDLQAFRNGDPAKPSYMALTVRVRSPKDVPQVEAAIKQLGFSTFSLLDATKGLRLVFTVFDLFLGLFGSLALTVASLGIINTPGTMFPNPGSLSRTRVPVHPFLRYLRVLIFGLEVLYDPPAKERAAPLLEPLHLEGRVQVDADLPDWFIFHTKQTCAVRPPSRAGHRDLCTRTRKVLRPIDGIEFLPVPVAIRGS